MATETKKPFYKSVIDTVTGFFGGGVTGAVVGGAVLALAGAALGVGALAVSGMLPSVGQAIASMGSFVGLQGPTVASVAAGAAQGANNAATAVTVGSGGNGILGAAVNGAITIGQKLAGTQVAQTAVPALAKTVELTAANMTFLQAGIAGSAVLGAIGAFIGGGIGSITGAVTGWDNSRPEVAAAPSNELAHQQEVARAQATGMVQGATLAKLEQVDGQVQVQQQQIVAEHQHAAMANDMALHAESHHWRDKCGHKEKPVLFTEQVAQERAVAAAAVSVPGVTA